MDAWLVTGGAGYIGSHVVRALRRSGRRPVVIDDLSSGHAAYLPDDVAFYRGSVRDRELLDEALRAEAVRGVVHLAGYKYAGESVARPLHTYEQNVVGTATLLAAMADAGVDALVNSSSAAVYGTPDVDLVDESTPPAPETPYGETKLVAEWLIRDQAVATGLRHTSLRYFNVVGSGDPALRDTSPHNLVPLVFAALREGRAPRIHGDDYPTPDGTCVRDYVPVEAIAAAHVAAADALTAGAALRPVYNLGSGRGASVREVVDAILAVTGAALEPEIGPRRAGDPARIVGSSAAAAADLGWDPSQSLRAVVESAWAAELAATTGAVP